MSREEMRLKDFANKKVHLPGIQTLNLQIRSVNALCSTRILCIDITPIAARLDPSLEILFWKSARFDRAVGAGYKVKRWHVVKIAVATS